MRSFRIPIFILLLTLLLCLFAGRKNTLTVEAIDEIFSMMLPEKKCEYDRAYIEELYLKYMEKGAVHEEHLSAIKETLRSKTILLIAPGKSSIDEQDKIATFLKRNDTIAISVNYKYPYADIAWIFASIREDVIIFVSKAPGLPDAQRSLIFRREAAKE